MVIILIFVFKSIFIWFIDGYLETRRHHQNPPRYSWDLHAKLSFDTCNGKSGTVDMMQFEYAWFYFYICMVHIILAKWLTANTTFVSTVFMNWCNIVWDREMERRSIKPEYFPHNLAIIKKSIAQKVDGSIGIDFNLKEIPPGLQKYLYCILDGFGSHWLSYQ